MSEKNRTILCVGNDEFGLEVRRLVLESFGYNAIVKPDCASALVVLGMRPIDLVVIDFSDLTEAHRKCIRMLRERHPQQRLMLLAPLPYVDKEIASYFDCVMIKGLAPEELKVAVENCLAPRSGKGKFAIALAIAGGWVGVASELLSRHSWRNSVRDPGVGTAPTRRHGTSRIQA